MILACGILTRVILVIHLFELCCPADSHLAVLWPDEFSCQYLNSVLDAVVAIGAEFALSAVVHNSIVLEPFAVVLIDIDLGG